MTDQDEMKEIANSIDNKDYPDNSVTFRVYYKGCSILATSRDVNKPLAPLVQKAMNGIDWALENGCKSSWNEDTNGRIKEAPTPEKEVKKATPKQLNYLANLLGTIPTDSNFIATYANQSAFAISKIIDTKLKEK